MTASRTLDVVVSLESSTVAERVAKALAVETDGAPPRTTVSVVAEGAQLRLHLEAPDARTLRAGANSFLRWLQTALEVTQQVRGASSNP